METYDRFEENRIATDDEYLNFQTPKLFLHPFQAKKAPEHERSIRQQTTEQNMYLWPIEYEIVCLPEYDFNVNMFWNSLSVNNSYNGKQKHTEPIKLKVLKNDST